MLERPNALGRLKGPVTPFLGSYRMIGNLTQGIAGGRRLLESFKRRAGRDPVPQRFQIRFG